jgi:hypothetical protein
MAKIIWMVVLAATVWNSARADDDFTVSIVGREQSSLNVFASESIEGLPMIYCPIAGSPQKTGSEEDKSESKSFFVVVQNTKDSAIKIKMLMSDWAECLSFKMTDSSGKVYSIHAGSAAYTLNAPYARTFPSHGMYVWPVDLTQVAEDWNNNSGWEGQPEASSEPELVTMTATFRSLNSAGKAVSVTSEPTEVYLSKPNDAE